MASFRRDKPKVQLRAPQAVRRFIHEQRIRVRLSRAGLKKPHSSEPGPAAAADTSPETLTQAASAADSGAGPGHRPNTDTKPKTRILQQLLLQTGVLPDIDLPEWGTALTALLLGVLLFSSPLYCFTSPRQPLPLYILTALAFAVFGFYRISKGELKFIRSPLDTAVFLLPGLALFSGVGAWDTGEAVNLALLLSCCAALYWIVSSLVDSPEALCAILTVFTASAAATSVLCLTAIFQEGVSYPSADALGALLASALLITFYLRTAYQGNTASRLHPALSAAGYLILLAITGINSVMLYIVLIMGIILSLWKLPTGERKKGIAHFLIYASMAFIFAGKVKLCLESGAVTAGWVWAALGLILVLALEYTLIIYQRSSRRLRPWVLPGAALLLCVLLLSSSTSYLRSNPSHPSGQAGSGDVHYYIEERLLKGRDALRIMVSSPRILLQGAGGGGWEPLSQQHQSFYYQDSPPGAFLQAGVEMGLPGLIILITIWILFFKGIKRTTSQSDLAEELNGTAWAARASWAADTPKAAEAAWPILTAALALGCCSLWECTLFMPALSLFLFTLFGLGQALDRQFIPERSRPASSKKLLQYLGIGCAALFVVIISWNFYTGESSAITARNALQKGDTHAALINYEKAVQKNPLNASYRKELGKLYLENGTQGTNGAKGTTDAVDANGAPNAKNTQNANAANAPKDAEALKLASNHFRKGVHLARGNGELRVLYAGTLFQRGQPTEGVRHLETAVLLRPLEQEFYEDLALGYVAAGRLLLEKPTQKERGRTYLRRAIGIPQLLEKHSAQINKRHLRYWSGAPYLGITPRIQLYCGQAAVLLGDRKAALHYLEQAALDVSLNAEAELWQDLIPPPENTSPSGDISYSSSSQDSP